MKSLIAAILTGVLATLLVAWGFSIWGTPLEASMSYVGPQPWPCEVPASWGWTNFRTVEPGLGVRRDTYISRRSRAAFLAVLDPTTPAAAGGHVEAGSVVIVSTGWPMPALTARKISGADGGPDRWVGSFPIPESLVRDDRIDPFDGMGLPGRPLVVGFTVDSLAFGAFAWVFISAFASLRRAVVGGLRSRRGCCRRCGHALHGLGTCPECGATSKGVWRIPAIPQIR